jgi:hypothetical protein
VRLYFPNGSRKDELYLSSNSRNAWGDDGSGDSSGDSDGNKGDSDDEVNDNTVERTDDNNQVRNVAEIEAVVQLSDSYVISFL